MYTIVGATGNTGSVVAKSLLAKGEKVRVLGRSAQRLAALTTAGAEPFVCSVTDRAALVKALTGVRAAYVMIPPDVTSKDARAEQERASDTLAAALQQAGTKHAVALSSIGADKAEKTGPVLGLHNLEQKLKRVAGLNVVFLRAGYFMENTLALIGAIKATGKASGPLRPNLKIPMIATRDIGVAAADALCQLDFTGTHTRELLGQRDISMAELTTIIGQAIGRPDLAYTQLADAQARQAMVQLGMSANVTDLILELAAALNSGHVRALEQRSARNTTSTSYEVFAAEQIVPHLRD